MNSDSRREKSLTGKSGRVPVKLPVEVRVHGRGGQGGVTCAKLIATLYAQLGLYVQTFGDYGSERTGAPIRAFTRVSDTPILNRNKVYRPDHILVLDPTLMGPEVLEGAAPGGVLVLNATGGTEDLARRCAGFRLGTVDATGIARRHGIGTSALVIVNTTIVGAYAHMVGLSMDLLKKAYAYAGLGENLSAAQEAYDSVVVHPFRETASQALSGDRRESVHRGPGSRVIPITEQVCDFPVPLKTGSWRTQLPRYQTHQAPCTNACPAGNDVVGFLRALRELGADSAARVLARTQPLPSVCGRVCPAFCMESCNRGALDGAVNIRSMERWIGDHGGAGREGPKHRDRPLDLAIVGGGPAGLSAAFTISVEGHHVTIFDRNPGLGGLLRTGIPAYRLPPEALARDIDRILAMGVEARCGEILDGHRVQAMTERYDAVILATGLQEKSRLPCAGSHLKGVEDGLGFLRRVKEDGNATVEGHVVVVGGGNSALDCARSALRSGAGKVSLIYRRRREEMPAIREEIEEALEEGVALVTLCQPVAFLGDERVQAIDLAEVELGTIDGSGRRRPVITDRIRRVACDRVFLALGQSADWGLLPEGWELRTGRAFCGVEAKNLWVAGDLGAAEGTVSHAIGHGRRVAQCVLDALGCGTGECFPQDPTDSSFLVLPDHIRFSHYESRPPGHDLRVVPATRVCGFDEVNLGLPDTREAERCFSCGQCTSCDTCLVYCPDGIIHRRADGYVIDESYCKGCGMCVAECPRQAMRMVQDMGGR